MSATIGGDMRRLSLVMAVAALDTYMHRLIVERAFKHDRLPSPLGRLDIPFEQLLAQADTTSVAARRARHNPRPRVGVKQKLRDRLLRETFQRYEDVSRALAMAGRSRNWDAIGRKLRPPQRPEQIRERLNSIVARRNQIVHEGDYRRLDRPRTPRRNGCNYRQTRSDINFLAGLIDAIHEVSHQ